MKKYIYIFALFFPVLIYVLNVVNESNGLIWMALDTAYYYPIFLLASPLFKEVEMGLLIPSIGGRILTFVLYAALLLMIYKVSNRKRSSQ